MKENKPFNQLAIVFLLSFMTLSGLAKNDSTLSTWIDKQLDYCDHQVNATLTQLSLCDSLPRSISKNSTEWVKISYGDWTSGFWPGILWYHYAFTRNKSDRRQAIR